MIRLRPIDISRIGAVDLIRQLVTARPAYRTIVTVPQWGLHYAAAAARIAGVPLACISDELKSDDEATDEGRRLWRARERRSHQRCEWTIALSDDRAAFIRRENGLPASQPVFVVPNASRGPARRLRSRYFHDALNLTCDARILLHAGSLWWRGAAEVIDAANDWRDRTLVFQTRMMMPDRQRDSATVRFAPTVLPAALLDYAVSSARIGLALYDTANVNNRLMGTASGKVALYLKNLLPVIATRAGGFEWIEREGCGICIDDVSEVPDAADRIEERYGEYVANAERVFNTTLDFETRFRPVADRLSAL
jgi:hypothetical protein